MQNVAACVVTYNSEETVGQLLASLLREECVGEIIVVDNASQDRTLERLRDHEDQRIVVLPQERNLGFPAATNIAIRHSSAPLVLLINPDVELRGDVLTELSAAVVDDETIGVVTCQLRTRDGQAQSEPARPIPTLRRVAATTAPPFVRRLASRSDRLSTPRRDLETVRDVGAAMGALLLMRRGVLDDVGLLDESVFMYLEDLDFSARLRRKGYRIQYRGDVWAWHDSGVSSQPVSTGLYALMPQVWISYFHRYGTPLQRWLIRPLLVTSCFLGMAETALSQPGRPNKYRRALFQALTFRARAIRW